MSGERQQPIVRRTIQLPGNAGKLNKLAFVLDNVLTKKECEEYIRKTEKKGYEMALVNVGMGRQKLMPDVRNNDRCIIDNEEDARKLWSRIQPYIPEVFCGRRVIGLNERLRFLRYKPNQYFAPHMDGMYKRENGERSYITVQFYLNEGFEGGSTTFLPNQFGGRNTDPEEEVPVVPKTGSVLVFQHDIVHEGSPLKSGVKYALRTDVMYSAEIIQ